MVSSHNQKGIRSRIIKICSYKVGGAAITPDYSIAESRKCHIKIMRNTKLVVERGIMSVRRPFRTKEQRASDRKQYLSEYYQQSEVKQRRHDNALRRCYGITWNDKVRMYHEQRGLCGFCGEPLDLEISKAHVDHNHETMEVRKLLHKHCNSTIGVFERKPELIDVLRGYLERSHAIRESESRSVFQYSQEGT